MFVKGCNFKWFGNLERKIEKEGNVGVITTYSFGTLSACLITVTHLTQLKTFELKSLCVFYME